MKSDLRIRGLCLNIFRCLFIYPVVGFSQGIGSGQPETISTGNLVNMISGLLVVLAIFFFIAYLLKRLSGVGTISRGYIKIIDALHLGTREKLLLVKVADTYMVLGISSGNINTLHVLDKDLPEPVEHIGNNFRSHLSEILSATKLKNN